MRNKLKTLRRLHAARERLRDVAAGEAAAAEQRRFAEQQAKDSCERTLTSVVRESHDRLRAASRISDLERVASDVAAASQATNTAAERLRGAQLDANKALSMLRAKERDLRTSEKLVEKAKQRRAESDARREQSAADDLSAARHRSIG